ncbi:hypothetical protein [Bradyrhizobium elkanii]|uniref:hypothetical protein n=1 Tax=Bradyrhizobium elkanii TaxID=29448 RepID=UPI0023EA548D|nr:hypothetical protein [Bradyrhizobium elkanii]
MRRNQSIVMVDINRGTDSSGPGRLVGDAAFHDLGRAQAITPIPCGVGLMTIACLLSNMLKAPQAREELRDGA